MAAPNTSRAHCSALTLRAILLLLPALATDAQAGPQLWSEVKVTSKWTDRFDLFAAGALRFDRDVSPHDRTSYQAGFNFDATHALTLTPSYQYIVHDPSEDVRSFEHRLGLVAALRLPVERFEATLSCGGEYRLRHDQGDGWRVRPRLKIKRPVGPDSWGLAAYGAAELFYDTAAADWTRDRLTAGFEKQMQRNWVLDLYYCHQHDLRSREPDLDIVGFAMRWSFDGSASDSRNESLEN